MVDKPNCTLVRVNKALIGDRGRCAHAAEVMGDRGRCAHAAEVIQDEQRHVGP